MSDSVGQYLNEIGLVPLLTADEERELSQTIERGRDAQARLDAGERGRELRKAVAAAAAAKDRFIRANLRLVVSIARRYPLPPSMELLDLIQEGNLGLEHAVDKFDWRKGFKFSTYATFWIRQAIGRALDQKASLVRLPGDRSASLRAALRQASGDGEELDDESARLYRLTTPTSLDRPVGDDDGSELVDLLAADVPTPEQVLLEREDEETLNDLLDVLDTRARYAVEQRFGLTDGRKRSYREVGEELGVTAGRPVAWSSVRSTRCARRLSRAPARRNAPSQTDNRRALHRGSAGSPPGPRTPAAPIPPRGGWFHSDASARIALPLVPTQRHDGAP
jgi:RNA polymerase primary sigma factor